MRTVNLIDNTTSRKPTASVLAAAAAALTKQAQSFCHDWQLAHAVTVVAGGTGGIPLWIEDTGDVPNALGWHQTDTKGQPQGYVLAGTVLDNGGTWTQGPNSVSAVASHELLEILGDLAANEFAFDGQRRLWAREACDPVEMRAYSVLGVAVSDYVLPAWFDPGAPGPYDKLTVLARSFSIDRGGYAIVETAGTESQVFGLADPGERWTVAPDPAGRFAVVVGPAFPSWRRALKDHGASRTLHRLTLGQQQ